MVEPLHQCAHYQRNCHVQAPCCGIFYSCKLCHDEQYKGPKANWCKVQRMEFQKVPKLKCLVCQEVMDPSQSCTNCKVKFGEYCCLKCKLFQNNPAKIDDIFHCDKCAMCRRGKAQENKHCDNCGYCINLQSYQKHQCMERKVQSNCPVCMQNLKYSTKYHAPLKCGHLIHNDCLDSLVQSGIVNCPTCGMSLYKMSNKEKQAIEAAIEQTKDQLPPQIAQKKVNIMCMECLAKTNDVPFHFYGFKCGACGTFNTKMI